MKVSARYLTLVMAMLATSSCSKVSPPAPASVTTQVGASPSLSLQRGLLVAHAMGVIDGVRETNSIEALRCNHARGFRWFELDLSLTADDQLVAFHRAREKQFGLPKAIGELTLEEVTGAKHKGFGIPTLRDVLGEAEKLRDTVLVIDAKSWPKKMSEAISDLVTSGGGGPSAPRLVLHAYGEKDIRAVTLLAKEIGAGVILAVYDSEATDEEIEKLAKDYDVLAVLTDERRFSPWLATRLHAAHIAVLVNTINEHDKIAGMMLAGADGFYTDSYVSYDMMARDRAALFECNAREPPPQKLLPWVERDVLKKRDYYRLKPCVSRKSDRLEIGRCEEGPAISGPFLPVPPRSTVHVELGVEAPKSGAKFWFDIVNRKSEVPIRQREHITLAPSQRNVFTYEASLDKGSPGVEARLGFDSDAEGLIVHRLLVTARNLPGETISH